MFRYFFLFDENSESFSSRKLKVFVRAVEAALAALLLNASPRLLPASVLRARLALHDPTDRTAHAYRAELQRRPSHHHCELDITVLRAILLHIDQVDDHAVEREGSDLRYHS